MHFWGVAEELHFREDLCAFALLAAAAAATASLAAMAGTTSPRCALFRAGACALDDNCRIYPIQMSSTDLKIYVALYM